MQNNYALTKQDIAAIKHASYLHYMSNIEDNKHEMAAVLDESKSSTGFAQYHFIPVNYRIHQYGNSSWREPPAKHCNASSHYLSLSLEMQTWIKSLRAGDILCLEWTINNTSMILENANLSEDELDLIIIRNGKEIAQYRLESIVCPRDSFCRFTGIK